MKYANDPQASYKNKKNTMNYFSSKKNKSFGEMSAPERVGNLIVGVAHGSFLEFQKSKNLRTMGKNLYKTRPKKNEMFYDKKKGFY
ncbi:MAG: hypothetical protein VWZ97_00185 [Flavobacteriaceae bacterium]|jgi:hypothetical protein